jgi:RNA polymerase sigma-70 factor (ECF subfamily)
VRLKDQDRRLWNRELIEKGVYYLNRASDNAQPGEYLIEAAIAAYHALAETFEQTNWLGIFALYESLSRINPGPVVEMNKAIALGYCQSPRAAVDALLKIRGLEHSYQYYAALGEFYTALPAPDHALKAYDRALSLVTTRAERVLLERKRAGLCGEED